MTDVDIQRYIKDNGSDDFIQSFSGDDLSQQEQSISDDIMLAATLRKQIAELEKGQK